MEVGNHAVGHRESIGREDELVGPAFVGFDFAAYGHGRFEGLQRGGSYGKHVIVAIVSPVDQLAAALVDVHLFRIGFVLGEVLHLDVAEVAHAGVKRQFGKFATEQFDAFHQDFAEVHSGSGGRNSAFHLGVDGLEVVGVFGTFVAVQLTRDGGVTQPREGLFEFVVGPVVEETQGTTS